MTELQFRFYCRDEGEILFSTEEKKEFISIKDFLFQSRLTFRIREYKDARHDAIGGEATIEKKVPIAFKFLADIDNGCINLTINNFERIGSQKIILYPGQINETFL